MLKAGIGGAELDVFCMGNLISGFNGARLLIVRFNQTIY